MDASSIPVFQASGLLHDFIGVARTLPKLDDAPAGTAVGLAVTAALQDAHMDLSLPAFLVATGDGGFVLRDLVACLDAGPTADFFDAPLRAYGHMVLHTPSPGPLANHPGWAVSSDQTGYDLRTFLLFPEGAVLADTIHDHGLDPDDPDLLSGWGIVVPATSSAHDALAQQATIAVLRARAETWARAHIHEDDCA